MKKKILKGNRIRLYRPVKGNRKLTLDYLTTSGNLEITLSSGDHSGTFTLKEDDFRELILLLRNVFVCKGDFNFVRNYYYRSLTGKEHHLMVKTKLDYVQFTLWIRSNEVHFPLTASKFNVFYQNVLKIFDIFDD